MTLDHPFQVLVIILGEKPQRLAKIQVIGSVNPRRLATLPPQGTAVKLVGPTTQDRENQ